MTISETSKLSKHLCRLLKVPEVQWTLARTAKGNIGLAFNDSNDEFDIVLDSVKLSTANVLDDENNIELKKMVEKYFFSNPTVPMNFDAPIGTTTTIRMKPVESKKRGRPAKHANPTTKESS